MTRRLVALLAVLILATGAFVWLRARRSALPPPPTQARIDALRAERDALQARFRELVTSQGETSVAAAPKAGLMIGIPTSFTSSILEQVVTGLFGETTLTLRNLKVHKAGSVKAKMLVRKSKIGDYVLDVQIHKAQGILRPGKPVLDFGRNTVNVTLPVRLAEGTGEADLSLKWDSKGVTANMVCGDVDIKRAVTGNVVPQDYTVNGRFVVAASGNTIVLFPKFPDLAVRIFVDPSDQAWSVVDDVVKERSRGCEMALNKVNIKEKLAGILGKGFNVKVPQKIFKAIRLPAGLSQSLEVQGIKLALQLKPTGVLVANDRLWYGTDLSVSAKRPASR